MSDSVQNALLRSTTVHDDEAVVVDNDNYFIIDTITATVINKSGKKEFTRGNHNSERITFECDRYIEGHDVLFCNVIRIHYFAVNTPNIYDVTDVSVKQDDDSKVIFTWLISSNVTHIVGKIAFAVRFKCIQDSGEVTYSWGTKINEELSCADTIENSDAVIYENTDILEQWKRDLFDASQNEIDEAVNTYLEAHPPVTGATTEQVNQINRNTSDISGLREDTANLGTHKVAQPLDGNNQPTNGTSGQSLRTKGDGTTEWADVGLPTDEQTAQAVFNWLDEHPEATTTVQDGILTEAKFSNALKLKAIKDYVTPEMFGAVGDGSVDDSANIMQAIEYASLNNVGTVLFVGRYRVDNPIVLRNYRQDMDNKPVNLVMDNKGKMFENCLIANTGEACIKLINTHYINVILNIISSGYSSPVFDNPIPSDEIVASTIGIIATRENSGSSASSVLNTFGGSMRFQSDPTANDGYGTIGIYSDTSEEEIFENVALMSDTPIIITISDIANLTNNPITITCKDHRFVGHNHLISHKNKCVVLDGAINVTGTIYVNCESDDASAGSGLYISSNGVNNVTLNIDAERLKNAIDGSSSGGISESEFNITSSAIACVVHQVNTRNCRFVLSCYFYTGLDRWIVDNGTQTNCEFILQYAVSGSPNKFKSTNIYNGRFYLNNYTDVSTNIDSFITLEATNEKRYEVILGNGVHLNSFKAGFDWTWGKPSVPYSVGRGFIAFDRSSNIQNASGCPVGWYYDGVAFRPFGQVSVRTITASELATTAPRFKGEVIVDSNHKSHVAYGESAGEWSDMN